MAHTPPPLHIGCSIDGIGYALPSPFCIENGEVVEVQVDSDCYVYFDDHKAFPMSVDGPYTQGQTATWTPLPGVKDTTASFDVACPGRQPLQGSRSIKIGS